MKDKLAMGPLSYHTLARLLGPVEDHLPRSLRHLKAKGRSRRNSDRVWGFFSLLPSKGLGFRVWGFGL